MVFKKKNLKNWKASSSYKIWDLRRSVLSVLHCTLQQYYVNLPGNTLLANLTMLENELRLLIYVMLMLRTCQD